MEDLGFNGGLEEILRIWQYNAEKWPGISSPWRPSPSDIAIYSDFCKEKIPGEVLILGATPEIRDLFAENKIVPTVADISEAMLQKMSSLLKRATAEKEIWVKADWRELPLSPKSFDLIVGDMIWWTLSVSHQVEISRKIALLLKNDGIFVSRFRIKNDLSFDSPQQVIAKYLKAFDLNSGEEKLIRGAMLSVLYDITADTEKRRLNRDKVKDLLIEAAANYSSHEHKVFLEISAKSLIGANWTSQTKEEALAPLLEYFKVKNERYADDYDSQFYPIFSFSRRNS